jgi:hypothetical protein
MRGRARFRLPTSKGREKKKCDAPSICLVSYTYLPAVFLRFFEVPPRARFDFPSPFPHIHSPRLGVGRRAFACSSLSPNRLLSPPLCKRPNGFLTAFSLIIASCLRHEPRHGRFTEKGPRAWIVQRPESSAYGDSVKKWRTCGPSSPVEKVKCRGPWAK